MRKFLLAPFIWIARFFSPSEAGWYGATRALWILWILMVVSLFATDVIPKFSVSRAIGFGVFVATYTVAGVAVALAIWLISLIKPTYRLALLAGFFPVFFSGVMLFGVPGGVYFALAVFLFVSLIFGSLNALLKNKSSLLGRLSTCVFLGLGVLILAGLGYLLIKPAKPLNKFLDEYELADWTLDVANPGESGSFQVTALTYGSGTDQHRPEYGADADWISQSVDGSKLIDHWDGPTGWNRTKYWGFDSTSLPIQGRVWMPEGDGPFPLVLIVHGNHSMEEHSDNGFQYLGEHLASRGFILVSVDETFLNGSTANKIDPRYWGLGEENDARGWMLLEHLAQWQNWNSESGHPMAGKIDMDRIALIGHSRGGEAVAVAAAFNDLDFYPDDATVAFDYKFNIRACIAIAPADGQYKPREERMKLKDINYFTIQGAMDGDVNSFMGSSQYSRISLTPGSDYVKASMYLASANHGQFNTSRSIYDTDDLLFGWLLNTKDIMPATDQRQIARVYFTAFLEAMLNNQKSYLPLFSDARYGANWLPKTYYVNNMQRGSNTYFANFEEDLNPGSGSTAGAKIAGHNLSKWRESLLNLKWNPLDSIVAVLAWDNEVQEETAEYHIQWDDGAIETGLDSKLVFSACVLDESTKPKDWTESDQDKIKAEATESSEDKAVSNGEAIEEEERTPLDWTIVVTDTEGRESRLKLSTDQPLYPQIQSRTSRMPLLSTNPTSEIVMRRFTLPLSKFVEANSTFDPLSIVSMKFVFDQTKKGIIAVDDFGIE